jgi:hypothetical protein
MDRRNSRFCTAPTIYKFVMYARCDLHRSCTCSVWCRCNLQSSMFIHNGRNPARCTAGSGPMRPCATARGPYQKRVYNFVYPSIYISIHLKKLQGPAHHVPCGLCRRLDSSRSSQPIAIVTSPIAPASSLRAHAPYTLDLGHMPLTWPRAPPNIDPALARCSIWHS